MARLDNSPKPEPIVIGNELRDGQIGIVLEGPMKDRLIQRTGKHIFTIGGKSESIWENGCTCRIRKLKNGESIFVTNN